MKGLGTIVNVLAVLAGGLIGMVVKKGLKPRFQEILMQALGLATMFLGLAGTLSKMLQVGEGGLESVGTMSMIFSLVLGSLLGEALNLEDGMEHFGEWLKARFDKNGKGNTFVEGFVVSSLTICIGAMAIVGSIEDGLMGNHATLFAKAVLDMVIIMVFAAAYGKGAMFSAIPVGIWQGSVTLLAGFIAPVLTDQMISSISYVGNMLIFCVGVNLAFGKRFRVANMLPALLFAALASALWGFA